VGGLGKKGSGDGGRERRNPSRDERFARLRFVRRATPPALPVPVPERGLAVVAPDGVPGRRESRVGDAGDVRGDGVPAGEEG
jgi:hypothetical protein